MTQRIETDILGDMALPANALIGIQTARAVENFQISDLPISHFPRLVEALATVKKAVARTNLEAGVLSAEKANIIENVCDEILDGRRHENFVVDMFQGGAGT